MDLIKQLRKTPKHRNHNSNEQRTEAVLVSRCPSRKSAVHRLPCCIRPRPRRPITSQACFAPTPGASSGTFQGFLPFPSFAVAPYSFFVLLLHFVHPTFPPLLLFIFCLLHVDHNGGCIGATGPDPHRISNFKLWTVLQSRSSI
jgi:hypothetical protein